MNMAKRFLAIAVVAVMLVSSCVFASADEYVFSLVNNNSGHTYEDGNLVYTNYTVTSGQNGNYVVGTALEFDPADGYIPMVFSGYSGTSGTLKTQYSLATGRYGYDVAGIINGSFFSMDSGSTKYGNYGTLTSYIISNGKVASAHAGCSDNVVAFGSDGSINVVNSSLDYKLYINGAEMNNGIYYINKTSGSKVASNWNNGFYYFDRSCGSKCDTYEICPGYEVLCKKVDNTDLAVGQTLIGEVVSVTENAYGGEIGTDEFILFVKNNSPNAAYVKDLQAGDEINISVSETIASSKEIIENANSVISNVGWLVKDGVDQTQIVANIGTHSVTLQARWTAFGIKEDGSYVFFTTEGASTGSNGSVTLRDVAAAMIEMGCVNVIRMDGGGSSAMYLKDAGDGEPGYVQVSKDYDRPVGDCILVVKAESAGDEELNAALAASIEEAKAAVAETPNSELEEIIAEAEAMLASGVIVSGDARRMIMNISSAMSGKSKLIDAVALVSGISFSDYSEYVLDRLRDAYDNAVYLIGADDATIDEILSATEELNYWYSLSGDVSVNLSLGASYTTTKNDRNDIYADDLIKLTDGSAGFSDPGTAKYSGWSSKGSPIEIIVDLGEIQDNIDTFKSYMAYGTWGISECSSCSISVSKDGSKYTDVAAEFSSEVTADTDSWDTEAYTFTLANAVSARYVKFTFTGSNFVWLDEVEVFANHKAITNGIYLTGFNTKIGAEYSVIFTSAMGEISSASANLNWTLNFLCEWDEDQQGYVVVKKWQNNGSTAVQTLAENQIILAVHSDKTTEGSNKWIANQGKVGQVLVLHGVDVAECAVSAGAYLTFEDPASKYETGDVNCDGSVNATDYIMLKRAVLGTYTLSEESKETADINGDETINQTDYLMLKRAILGTYVIG